MYTLVIEGKEYVQPTKLTIRQWVDIVKWDVNNESHHAQVLSIAMGIPMEYAMMIPKDTLKMGVSLLVFLLNPIFKPYKNEVSGHKLIDFSSMTFGQFVDLEVLIDTGVNDNTAKIVSILYDCEDVLDWDIADVFGSISAYISYRVHLFKQYRKLFSYEGDTDDEEVQNRSMARVWYDIIMTIAEGKLLNIEPTINRPAIECLNWLAWNKDQKRLQQ